MNQLVFILHVGIVLLVPAFFGWTVLRRVFREADLLVLVPGSFVVGTLGLMALLNEVRFYLPMASATWTTYKILLALSLVALLATRAPRRRPLLSRQLGAGKLALLLVAAVTSGIYFGIPAFRGVLNDAWWFHYPEANHIQTIPRFPLTLVFAPDDMLYYHYGPDLLAATWSFLLERPVPTGFALNVACFVPAALLLAAALVIRLTHNYWSGLAAGVLLVVGGNLRFLGLLGSTWGETTSVLQAVNSQTVEGLLELAFTPSHVLGVPAVLVALVLFRHFAVRPTWPRAGVLGLWLGMITLIAEWYILPLLASLGAWLAWAWWRGRRTGGGAWHRPGRLALGAAPLAIALAWGAFNNTYLAGAFAHFWTRHQTIHTASSVRLTEYRHQRIAELSAEAPVLVAADALLAAEPGPPGAAAGGSGGSLAAGIARLTEQARANTREVARLRAEPLAMPSSPTQGVPQLVPLGINLDHFGRVPSWEAAGSDGATMVWIFSPRVIAEFLPLLGLGLPLGLLWWRRSGHPVALVLVGMTVLSVIPPIFLDWGYRSTDFLRFFTAAHSWSALLLGIWIGGWLTSPRRGLRAAGAALLVLGLANAAVLGLVGLRGDTIDTVRSISAKAGSLSDATRSAPAPGSSPAADSPAARAGHFERLSRRADAYLYPLTGGHARVLVVVDPAELPPQVEFPEWLKFASYVRAVVPVGRHWNDSLYTAYYRKAMVDADAEAMAALGVRWVVLTDALGPPPDRIRHELQSSLRYLPAVTFTSGSYYLTLYRVL